MAGGAGDLRFLEIGWVLVFDVCLNWRRLDDI